MNSPPINTLVIASSVTTITKNLKKGQSEVRMIHASQLGYVCIVETPESESCNLVQVKAVSYLSTIPRNGYITNEGCQPEDGCS